MNHHRLPALILGTAVIFALASTAGSANADLKGQAILDHACGKVAVKHMGLVNAGKMDEANLLATKEMQDMWKAMPAQDRTMISGMMKEMSKTSEQYAADIKANGLLVVNGQTVTLTVKETTKDANGSGTSTTTQNFRMNGAACLINR